MEFNPPLQQGTFLKRYKRFFADIEFNGETITAHCPNTGSMKGCMFPGEPCMFSTTADPKRKLKHTLQMIKAPNTWVGVNTGLPNKLVHELFTNKPLKHWQAFDRAQMELKISDKSRIDMVLWNSQDHDVTKWKPKAIEKPMHLIEIKNVTLGDGDEASFPDAVTERGQKHIDELMTLQKQGFTTEMVYVVQRTDCKVFRPADDIDPVYGQKLREAVKIGVKATALLTEMSAEKVQLTGTEIPIEL